MFTCPVCLKEIDQLYIGFSIHTWECRCAASHLKKYEDGSYKLSVKFRELSLTRITELDGNTYVRVQIDGVDHCLRSDDLIEQMSSDVMRRIHIESVMES